MQVSWYDSPDRYHLKQLAERSAALLLLSHRLRSESKKIRTEAALIRQNHRGAPDATNKALVLVSDTERFAAASYALIRLSVRTVDDPDILRLYMSRDLRNSS